MNPQALTKREGVALFFATALIGARDRQARKPKSSMTNAHVMRDAFAFAAAFIEQAKKQPE